MIIVILLVATLFPVGKSIDGPRNDEKCPSDLHSEKCSCI
jgi:hypothetical protein